VVQIRVGNMTFNSRFTDRARRCLLASLLLAVSFSALSQTSDTPVAEAPPPVSVPFDEFDRGTPSRSADGFLAAVDEGDYERAAEYLDLRNLRGAASGVDGPELARRLFVVVRRATWIDIDELVDDPDGRQQDGLPAYRDSIGVVVDDDKEVRLFMQKVPRGDGVSIWKVSNATVSLIPELYNVYGFSESIESLRRAVPDVTFLGLDLFKWILLLIVAVVAYVAVLILAAVVQRSQQDSAAPNAQRVQAFLRRPFALWVVVIALNATATSLGTGVTYANWQRLTPIPSLITVWLAFAGMNLLRDMYASRLREQNRPGAAILLNPTINAIKLLVCVVAVLHYLDKLGVDITTLIAGLGVGGVAVALALQKPLEDVFGALTLYTQQPMRVGDFCRFGSETGVVEEIGLRTTRIRTLANTVIAVPNARLANEPIDNISARQKIRFNTTLRLRYDTTPEQLDQVLAKLRALLSEHSDVLPEDQRVRFREIGEDAYLIEINCYLNTTQWGEYLELAEGLNMRIVSIIKLAGTRFAPPTQALQMEQE